MKERGRFRIGRRLLVAIVLAAAAATLSTLSWPPERFSQPALVTFLRPLHNLENFGYDALMGLQGQRRDLIDPRIVVLGIGDNDSHELHETFPFTRNLHAKVIENLKKDGALLIAYDVLFDQPSSGSPGANAVANDRALDAAFKAAGNVILTSVIDYKTTSESREHYSVPYHDEKLGIDFEEHTRQGLANEPTDDYVRTMVPAETSQGEVVPSFPLAVYLALNHLDDSVVHILKNEVTAGPLKIPSTGPTGTDMHDGSPIPSVRIRYPGGSSAFETPRNFYQVANEGDYRDGAFKDKIVFVGVTGSQLAKEDKELFKTAYSHFHFEDVSGTAVSDEVPGVILQALHFNALLHNLYVTEAPTGAVWAMVFLSTLTAVSIVRRFSNLIGLTFAVLCGLSLFGFSYLCFTTWMMHIPWIVPNILMLTAAGGVGWLESGSIRKKWAGYVSPAVLQQILQTEGTLGAKRYEASVMFGDIRSFTSFSEKHSPEKVVYLLNRHLERMTTIVAKENGTIDKFLGDGLLAVFGAPIPFATSAEAAVRAAWHMRNAAQKPIVDEVGAEHVLSTGFGISTGPFLGGDIGSKRLRNWTVIGDTVNLASRLQGVTGQDDVIIDEPTYELVRSHVEVESLGAVTLKGKAQPVPCFRVTEWHDSPSR